MSADYHPISYIYIWVDNQRTYTGVIGVIISVRKGDSDTSKIVNSSRIPNLASKTGALCHIFRDIDVFSAFPGAALFGFHLGKSTENVNIVVPSKIAP